MKQKYSHLRADPNISRWYANVARGSLITANVYLKRLGYLCEMHGVSAQQIAAFDDQQAYDLLLDTVSSLEARHLAGSYVASVLKAVKSWLAFNGKPVTRRIKIAGVDETPTLKNERVPTQEELAKVFLAGDHKGRAACAFMAHSGLRPQVLGNYSGDDGLRVGDLPELVLGDRQVEFTSTPTLVRVRANLSKSGREYFAFLSNEGCDYLRDYLEMRMRTGEKLTSESAVITPKYAGNELITTVNISDIVRKCITRAGFAWRPYVLRAYFDTQLMVAESKGFIIRDYRTFFMGHKGDIEHRYTLNKGRLPEQVIEQMRESYGKAQRQLQTRETDNGQDRLTRIVRKQVLMAMGTAPEEITEAHFAMGDEEFSKFVRERLTLDVTNNGVRQKVVPLNEVELYLKTGWEFVGALSGDRAIMRVPAST